MDGWKGLTNEQNTNIIGLGIVCLEKIQENTNILGGMFIASRNNY